VGTKPSTAREQPDQRSQAGARNRCACAVGRSCWRKRYEGRPHQHGAPSQQDEAPTRHFFRPYHGAEMVAPVGHLGLSSPLGLGPEAYIEGPRGHSSVGRARALQASLGAKPSNAPVNSPNSSELGVPAIDRTQSYPSHRAEVPLAATLAITRARCEECDLCEKGPPAGEYDGCGRSASSPAFRRLSCQPCPRRGASRS
jgi:hypothetical protein